MEQQCLEAIRNWTGYGDRVTADVTDWFYTDQKYAGLTHETLHGEFTFAAEHAGNVLISFYASLVTSTHAEDDTVVFSLQTTSTTDKDEYKVCNEFQEPYVSIGEIWSKEYSDRSLQHMIGWRLGDTCFVINDFDLADEE